MILIFMVEGARAVSSFLHSVCNSWEHSASSGKDDVTIEILSDINIALHDGVVGGFVNSSSFHTKERGLEQSLRASESFISDGDDLSIWQFIALLEGRGGGSSLHFLFEVKGNVGELLLDISDNFSFSSGGEGVSSFSQDLHHVIGEISAGKIESENGMGKCIALVDWNSVGDTISRVHHNTSGSSRGIEGQHCLNGNVHCGGVEGLEHDLGHLLSVGLGVQRSLSEEDRVLFRGNSELIVEGMMPDLLHIVPVGDNAVLNWVFEGQNTSLGLSFISNVGVLLSHTNHDTSVSWSADD